MKQSTPMNVELAPIWQLVDSSSIGGIERHVGLLSAALSQLGYSSGVVLLADHGANPWLEQLRTADVPYCILSGGIKGLLKSVREKRPSLIHTHGYKAGILGRLVCLITRTPVVSTYHAGERGPFPVNLYQWVDELTGFLGGKIAVSRPIAQRLGSDVTLVPNFVKYDPVEPKKNLPRKVGFIGRLSYEKGPDLFCQLAKRFPALEWHIYGDGPMREGLESEFGDQVRFHGIVTDLTDVWSELGLVVIPSRAEGLPLACLESMAAGIPVLASRVGALPDVIEHGVTGWLFDPENMAGAEEWLRSWEMAPPVEQARIRRECREKIRDHYSTEARLPDILTVYGQKGLPI